MECAACGRDLRFKSNWDEWRLRLVAEDKDIAPGVGGLTERADLPPIRHDHYFCNRRCLANWASA